MIIYINLGSCMYYFVLGHNFLPADIMKYFFQAEQSLNITHRQSQGAALGL